MNPQKDQINPIPNQSPPKPEKAMTNGLDGSDWVDELVECDLCHEEYSMSLVEWSGRQMLCLDCRTEREV